MRPESGKVVPVGEQNRGGFVIIQIYVEMTIRVLRFLSQQESDTMRIASVAGRLLRCGDVVLLEGDLGTGKTHFVKGVAQSKGSEANVTSPTFSIANFYKTPGCDILHIDSYRIATEDEFVNLGLQDYFPQCIVLAEWTQKFELLFEQYLSVTLEYQEAGAKDNARAITVSHKGAGFDALFDSLQQECADLLC